MNPSPKETRHRAFTRSTPADLTAHSISPQATLSPPGSWHTLFNPRRTPMRKGIVLGLSLSLSLFVSTVDASAQAAEPQALTIEAENITARAGERPGVAPDASLPGDVIEYRLTFTNYQDGPISDVVLNDPIPAGLVFVPGSVTASRADLRIEYSIDAGASWSESPEVEVQVAGTAVRQAATTETYTHVRWTVTGSVNPGAQVTARFRARVAGAPNPGGDA